MNVLILGSGGREHALAWKISQNQRLNDLFCAPGSSAISELAQCVPLDILDPRAVVSFCADHRIDIVLIGPEAPLEAGVADELRGARIKVFGPDQAAARLESSKAFAKEFMGRHKIPTASWKVFSDAAAARAALRSMSLPLVIKADGLASGKGVRVCRSREQALTAVSEFMETRTLGRAGRTVIVESCLEGPEISIMILCDGKNYRLLPASRDHKRLRDNDEGPNTGGMGAYAPVHLDEQTLRIIKTQILNRTLAGLRAEKLDYRGLLYAGLMLTKDGPQVLEYNCRFGDPETQAVLPLMKDDLLDLAVACAEQKLEAGEIKLESNCCVCVTLACAGYPEKPVTGKPIAGLESIRESRDLMIFHAGTVKKGEHWLSAGGRVLGIACVGPDLSTACEKAYTAVSKISFDGMQYRRDIAAKAPAAK